MCGAGWTTSLNRADPSRCGSPIDSTTSAAGLLRYCPGATGRRTRCGAGTRPGCARCAPSRRDGSTPAPAAPAAAPPARGPSPRRSPRRCGRRRLRAPPDAPTSGDVTDPTPRASWIGRIMEPWPRTRSTVSCPPISTRPTSPSGRQAPCSSALDGSPADEAVVDWAADEAARLDAPLRLVNVVDPGVQLTPYETLSRGRPEPRRGHRPGRAPSPRPGQTPGARPPPGLSTSPPTCRGVPPAAALVRLSTARPAPRRRRARARHGSSASCSARCPAGHRARALPGGRRPGRRRRRRPAAILVAVDGSETSIRAVEVALRACRGERGRGHLRARLAPRGSTRESSSPSRRASAGRRSSNGMPRSFTGPSTPVAARHPGVDVDLWCATDRPHARSWRWLLSSRPTSSSSAAGDSEASRASCSGR